MKSSCEACSRQIRARANHLQNTDIKGQRHLNDATRDAQSSQQSREAFVKRLQAISAQGRNAGASREAAEGTEGEATER